MVYIGYFIEANKSYSTSIFTVRSQVKAPALKVGPIPMVKNLLRGPLAWLLKTFKTDGQTWYFDRIFPIIKIYAT